jgi:hypothetical protein
MNKLFFALILVAVTGCNFDTGSNSYTKTIGKSIPLECFKSNLKSINGLDVGTETESSMVLVAPGISSVIEFESADAAVKSYSISTRTEKSSDSEYHKTVEVAINRPCNP